MHDPYKLLFLKRRKKARTRGDVDRDGTIVIR